MTSTNCRHLHLFRIAASKPCQAADLARHMRWQVKATSDQSLGEVQVLMWVSRDCIDRSIIVIRAIEFDLSGLPLFSQRRAVFISHGLSRRESGGGWQAIEPAFCFATPDKSFLAQFLDLNAALADFGVKRRARNPCPLQEFLHGHGAGCFSVVLDHGHCPL
jgi:hypothetical protein